MDVLARVRHLLELASKTSSQEEARTAALQACRLIAKHGLVVRLPTVPASEAADAGTASAGAGNRPWRHQKPSARVRTPLRVNHTDLTRLVRDMAQEAASRVTIADVVEVAQAVVSRKR